MHIDNIIFILCLRSLGTLKLKNTYGAMYPNMLSKNFVLFCEILNLLLYSGDIHACILIEFTVQQILFGYTP